jgi:hypothetical protein
MSSIEGLRCITMDTVPINVVLENLPKPTRVTGFDINKINDAKSTKANPKVFTFSPESITTVHLDNNGKQKVE